MSWAIVAGAGIAAAGQATSADSARKASSAAERSSGPLKLIQFKTAEVRLRLARLLEEVANKKLRDEPLSDAERNLFEKANTIAQRKIDEARVEARDRTLGDLAGMGRLTSRQAQEQIRRLNIETGKQKTDAELSREFALRDAEMKQEQLGLQAALGAMGVQQPNFQQFPQGLQPGAITGAGLSNIGGALINIGGQQQASQQQRDFLEEQRNLAALEASSKSGQRGDVFGVTAFDVGRK
jgi:hypothetical protein